MRLSKDEIEAQLQGVPNDKCMAFALRSAMRVLPLLSERNKQAGKQSHKAFWFWKTTDSAKHLLAVYRAYAYALENFSRLPSHKITATDSHVFLTFSYAPTSTTTSSTSNADATNAAARSAVRSLAARSAVDSAYAAAYSSDAAYAAIHADAAYTAAYTYAAYDYADAAYDYADSGSDVDVDVDVDAAYAAYAAYACAYVNYAADAIILEIRHDLAQLLALSASELLTQPLWSQPIPLDWQQLQANFKNDALNLDAGFEVWLDWYEDRLQGNPFDLKLLKQWNNIPAEIEQQGAAKVNSYLKSLVQKTATRPLNCVRAIFLGYGEAGKTSLIRALHDEPVVEGKEDMTAGIDIRNWPVPNSEIKAHFWDFGGQVMAHATHQFFLRERCLYVLVLNARSEINSNEQAEYWLEHVKAFGNHAPVMIVGNKADQSTINLDMNHLKEKYPNIIDFYPLSCTHANTDYKAKFDSFKQDFCQQLCEVGTHQMLFTSEQFAVLEELHEYSANSAFLKHQEFKEICERNGVGDIGELDREWLLDILDKLGVVIHFPQLSFLDEYVLNPRWLTHGVYTLMYERKARLSEEDAVSILHNKQIHDENGRVLDYPKDKCRFILDAMREFKLSYPVKNESSFLFCKHQSNTFIVPELLPSSRPENIPFKKSGALAFEFKFTGFLPHHIMPELIVTRHEEILDEIVWQNGVLLKHHCSSALALLEVSYHERIINIWVQGRDAKSYLAILNDEVSKILGRFKDSKGLNSLNYEEYVELPLSACIGNRVEEMAVPEKADYRQLLNFVRTGKYDFPTKHNSYDLRIVLGIITSDNELTRMGININKLFLGDNVKEKNMSKVEIGSNNNIDGSVIVSKKIKNSFNALKESKAETEVQKLLEQLLDEIKILNAKVPSVQVQDAEDMAICAEILINESKREFPRKEWYQFNLKGIKDAALALKELSEPVLKIIETLGPLLLS